MKTLRFLTSTIVAILLGLVLVSSARAEGEDQVVVASDLNEKSAPAAKPSSDEKINSEIEKLTIDSEMADVDTFANKETAKDAVTEAASLKREAGELKIHVKQLNTESKKAREASLRAQKRLEAQKIAIVALKKQIQRAEKANAQESKKQTAIEKQLSLAKDKAASLKEKNDELQASIRSLKKSNAANERSLKKANAHVAQEKARQKKLRSKRAEIMKSSRSRSS